MGLFTGETRYHLQPAANLKRLLEALMEPVGWAGYRGGHQSTLMRGATRRFYGARLP